MSDVVVRRARMNDVDAMVDLMETVAAEAKWIGTETPFDRAERARRFARGISGETDVATWVAVDRGAVVGTASLHGNGLLELGMMVAPGSRGRGIGKALLRACLDHARAAGAHKIALQVWPHNHAARKLYEAHGFVQEGYLSKHWRRRNGELWDAVVMGLVLDPGDRAPSDDVVPCGPA